MYRFYRRFVEQLITNLFVLRKLGWKIENINQYIIDLARATLTEEERQLLNTIQEFKIFQRGAADDETLKSLDTMISLMMDQLLGQGLPEATLLDTIVGVTGLEYGNNVLSGRTLKQLRKAILLPNEIAEFTERIKRREMHCEYCGHEFANGEMATMYHGVDGARIWCSSCRTPEMIACPSCKGSMEIPQKMHKGLAGLVKPCPKCANAGTTPEMQVDLGGTLVNDQPIYGNMEITTPTPTPAANRPRRIVRTRVLEPMPGGDNPPTATTTDYRLTYFDEARLPTAAQPTLTEEGLARAVYQEAIWEINAAERQEPR